MDKNKITDEQFEKIKKYINRYSYLDLVMWRNEMITSGNIQNRVYDLVDYELMKRNIEIYNLKHEGKSK